MGHAMNRLLPTLRQSAVLFDTETQRVREIKPATAGPEAGLRRSFFIHTTLTLSIVLISSFHLSSSARCCRSIPLRVTNGYSKETLRDSTFRCNGRNRANKQRVCHCSSNRLSTLEQHVMERTRPRLWPGRLVCRLVSQKANMNCGGTTVDMKQSNY